MERDVFAERFDAAAQAALEFARELVTEALPPRLTFRVRLNQSSDGHPPQPGEARFPQDGDEHRAAELRNVDARTVVAELWRDGKVPEWINLSAISETGAETLIEVVCCGRFTDDETRLYHAGEGVPPFHVLGPVLPPRRDGTRFSIHHSAECWDRWEALHLATVADDVWSLDLRTDAFDERLLAALPQLPNLEIFEHHACTLPGLSAFARFPKLRHLRLHLRAPHDFRVDAGGPPLPGLTELTITNAPSRAWGDTALAELAPGVTTVDLSATGTLWFDGPLGPAVRNVSLAAAGLRGTSRLPAALDHLGVRLTDGTDHAVAALLRTVTDVRSLSLRGTPVTDAVMPLLERYDLSHLDLVGTAATPARLARFRADHPTVGLLPRSLPSSEAP